MCPMVWPCSYEIKPCEWALPGAAGMVEHRNLSFPGVSPSRTSVRARRGRGLLGQHVVGALHPRGWEHVRVPEWTLRGGSCAHVYLGATASDLGHVGESERLVSIQ